MVYSSNSEYIHHKKYLCSVTGITGEQGVSGTNGVSGIKGGYGTHQESIETSVVNINTLESHNSEFDIHGILTTNCYYELTIIINFEIDSTGRDPTEEDIYTYADNLNYISYSISVDSGNINIYNESNDDDNLKHHIPSYSEYIYSDEAVKWENKVTYASKTINDIILLSDTNIGYNYLNTKESNIPIKLNINLHNSTNGNVNYTAFLKILSYKS
jgi:hypothetical protein